MNRFIESKRAYAIRNMIRVEIDDTSRPTASGGSLSAGFLMRTGFGYLMSVVTCELRLMIGLGFQPAVSEEKANDRRPYI